MDVRLNNDYRNYVNSYKTVEEKKTDVSEQKEEVNLSNEDSKKEFDNKHLEKSIKKLNKFLEDDKTHAEYSVHKDLGTIMVKIVDDENDKVIMELPPEKVLDMVASMCKQVGLLDEKA